MSNLIDRQKLIDVFTGLVLYADLDGAPKSYFDGLKEAYNLICQCPSAHLDFSTVEKINRAYDDGYKCGYLQAKFDYETDTRGEQDEAD